MKIRTFTVISAAVVSLSLAAPSFLILMFIFCANTQAKPVKLPFNVPPPIFAFCKTEACFLFLKGNSNNDTDVEIPSTNKEGINSNGMFFKVPYESLPQYKAIIPTHCHKERIYNNINYDQDHDSLNLIYKTNNEKEFGFLSFKVGTNPAVNPDCIDMPLPENPVSLSSSGKESIVASSDKIWLIEQENISLLELPKYITKDNGFSFKKIVYDASNGDIYIAASKTLNGTGRGVFFYRYEKINGVYKKEGVNKLPLPEFNDESSMYKDFAISSKYLYIVSTNYEEYSKADAASIITVNKKTGEIDPLNLTTLGNYHSLSVINDKLFWVIVDNYSTEDNFTVWEQHGSRFILHRGKVSRAEVVNRKVVVTKSVNNSGVNMLIYGTTPVNCRDASIDFAYKSFEGKGCIFFEIHSIY